MRVGKERVSARILHHQIRIQLLFYSLSWPDSVLSECWDDRSPHLAKKSAFSVSLESLKLPLALPELVSLSSYVRVGVFLFLFLFGWLVLSFVFGALTHNSNK